MGKFCFVVLYNVLYEFFYIAWLSVCGIVRTVAALKREDVCPECLVIVSQQHDERRALRKAFVGESV